MNTMRPTVKAIDDLIGAYFPVHDHGFISVVDYMGSDSEIAAAARTSYKKGTKKISNDENLIRYLYRKRHTSPFEMCEIKLHCKMPIFVARQWVRHRTASLCEMSGRYSEMPREFYIPRAERIKQQSIKNKQGSSDSFSAKNSQMICNEMIEESKNSFYMYNGWLTQDGLTRELARLILPLNTYTEWVWKIDLRNLLHFLSLRMDSHAQEEIRDYANIIGNKIVAPWVPYTWKAFNDYSFNAITLSALETEIIQALQKKEEMRRIWIKNGWNKVRCREREEALEKLAKLNINISDVKLLNTTN